ncbi:hypothetical protein [Flavobacterium sp.]|uniref:hypothetical protein n=1 Tax=Flavobacterium sp. TaxID=239 RepID=UPI0039E457C2
MTSPATVCKIGYQSQPTFEAYPYLIEIVDNTAGVTVYSGNLAFSSTATEYVSIAPVALTVGHAYTIKRKQQNYTGDVSIYIGRVIEKSNGTPLGFPYNLGILKITGSSIYEGMSDNYTLPYIDLVFE